MNLNIKKHDASKRYVVNVSCGTIKKKIHIPEGVTMPLSFAKSNLPDGKAEGEYCCVGGSVSKFSFDVKNGEYSHSNDNLTITN